MNIGEEIRARRKVKGFSIYELSCLSGVSMAAISKFERGLGDLCVSKLEAICKALNVSIKLVDADRS